MAVRGAALVFKVDGGFGARHLTVSDGESADPVWSGDLSEGEITAVDEELRATLTRIHDIASDDLEPTAAASSAAVATLLELAKRVGFGLFRGRPLGELQKASWTRAPFALNPAKTPRVVEVSSPDDFGYPFELIPWHRAGDDIQDPALRARTLLGMSAIVRRRLGGLPQSGGTGPIPNDPRLPITVFQHPKFATKESEADYLNDARNIVEVYGPWPGAAGLGELAAVHHLLDSRYSLDGLARTAPVSILHFACHCDTTSNNSFDHRIEVGGDYGGILLGELKAAASEPEAWNALTPRPLVFLNACGSAVPQLASRVSFPAFFLSQESLGVVGTLCDISTDVAAHFAAVFYAALLRGCTVGEAMYDARWHLMDRHRNPLGLLYTYYGNPDLKVAYQRAGQIVPPCSPS